MAKPLLKTSGAAVALALFAAGPTAVHSNSAAIAVIKAAESDARNAAKALAKRKPDTAVRYAEQAVRLRPQDGNYRALLGKAYLAAGRYFSAKQAFADALQLDPGLPGVALNLALATTATGDYAAAQQILAAHAASIPDADRGLAIALAGNPLGAIEILLPAARAVGSDAKTRQNLALAFALAGQWREARQVAAVDLSPTDLDDRIMQWAAFARPAAASDQVLTLLGVTPVADGGQPVQLALVDSASQVAIVPDPTPPDSPVETAAVAPPEVAAPAPRPSVGQIVFAAPREVVQALPALAIREMRTVRTTAPLRLMVPARIASIARVKGNFFVQLGAFDNVAVAKWGWDRVHARHRVLSGQTPYTMGASGGLVRLSVGGFDRDDATAICRTIQAKGGSCFVRVGGGDRVASWVGGRTQVAGR